ncbi:hypothetical protein KEM52_005687, partial [Ascosphaera acerosa]
ASQTSTGRRRWTNKVLKKVQSLGKFLPHKRSGRQPRPVYSDRNQDSASARRVRAIMRGEGPSGSGQRMSGGMGA